jgi:hypothetical protein
MNVTTNMPATVQIRRTLLLGLIATVAAVAVAGTWAIASAVDAGTHSARTTVPTTASVLSSLSPSERQHVQAITSMTPAQLKATFGTGNVDAIDALRLTPKAERYVRAISAMTPAELKATFGTGNVDAIDALGLSPTAETYVRTVTSMTPAELKATFGTSGR